MKKLLAEGIIPFWLEKSPDWIHGGYNTCFDDKGQPLDNTIKNIVTQARMVWGFSALMPYAREKDKEKMHKAATLGAKFLVQKFWDQEFGGFYWLLDQKGDVIDSSKLTYGEGFGIYALAQYYISYGDEWAYEYACKTFDLLQKYATDTLNGGYFENIERDWSLSPFGDKCGDRKSLDIHMHLMEAFSTLARATGKEIHIRKLEQVYHLILKHMINTADGYGYNQFDLAFNKIPAINIPRTWNQEREKGEVIEVPTDTTSYGHNVELSWLGDEALDIIGHRSVQDSAVLERLLDHASRLGIDYEYGGIYRDGIGNQSVLITDKEWWQNFEAMTGFLNGYTLYQKENYLENFKNVWEFIQANFLIPEQGESRQLLKRDGSPIISNIGNPWKGIYHTGRAIKECIERIDKIV
jgi:mannobiose 2-epimerase